jgi:hypothetical protein
MIRFLIGLWLIVMEIGANMSVEIACDDEDVKGAITFLVTLGLTSATAEFGFWLIVTAIERLDESNVWLLDRMYNSDFLHPLHCGR